MLTLIFHGQIWPETVFTFDKKYMKNILVLVFIAFAFVVPSCKKTTTIQPTEAEVIAAQLKTLISSEGVKRVIPLEHTANFDNTQFLGDYGANYSFEGPFVKMEGKAYNLAYLKKYEIRVLGNAIKYLGLYF